MRRNTAFRYTFLLISFFVVVSCARKIAVTSAKPENATVTAPAKTTKSLAARKSATSKASPPAKALTTYQSGGNDVADIVIRLLNNKKFDFQMTLKRQEGEKKDERITMGGSWKQDSKGTILQFDRKDVDLKALFDKAYDAGGEFEILDAHRVSINTQLAVIHVWGVACEKK